TDPRTGANAQPVDFIDREGRQNYRRPAVYARGSPMRSNVRSDRVIIAPGITGWLYEYGDRRPRTRLGGLSSGIEIGVQLEGNSTPAGSGSKPRVYGPGHIDVISPAESYDTSHRAEATPVVQVGFIIYPEEVAGYASVV